MSKRVLSVRSRQRRVVLDLKVIRKITHWLLSEELGVESYELSLQFVGAAESAELNETYLRHEGPTDVITFDYGDRGEQPSLVGDVIICVDEAIAQAPQFRTVWQAELLRYIVHGVLHLLGFDDRTPSRRRLMKQRENELMRTAARRFAPAKVGRRVGRVGC